MSSPSSAALNGAGCTDICLGPGSVRPSPRPTLEARGPCSARLIDRASPGLGFCQAWPRHNCVRSLQQASGRTEVGRHGSSAYGGRTDFGWRICASPPPVRAPAQPCERRRSGGHRAQWCAGHSVVVAGGADCGDSQAGGRARGCERSAAAACLRPLTFWRAGPTRQRHGWSSHRPYTARLSRRCSRSSAALRDCMPGTTGCRRARSSPSNSWARCCVEARGHASW